MLLEKFLPRVIDAELLITQLFEFINNLLDLVFDCPGLKEAYMALILVVVK